MEVRGGSDPQADKSCRQRQHGPLRLGAVRTVQLGADSDGVAHLCDGRLGGGGFVRAVRHIGVPLVGEMILDLFGNCGMGLLPTDLAADRF